MFSSIIALKTVNFCTKNKDLCLRKGFIGKPHAYIKKAISDIMYHGVYYRKSYIVLRNVGIVHRTPYILYRFYETGCRFSEQGKGLFLNVYPDSVAAGKRSRLHKKLLPFLR